MSFDICEHLQTVSQEARWMEVKKYYVSYQITHLFPSFDWGEALQFQTLKTLVRSTSCRISCETLKCRIHKIHSFIRHIWQSDIHFSFQLPISVFAKFHECFHLAIESQLCSQLSVLKTWPHKFHLKEASAPRAELSSVLSIDRNENAPVLLSHPRKPHESVWGQKLAHIVVLVYFCICDCVYAPVTESCQAETLLKWCNQYSCLLEQSEVHLLLTSGMKTGICVCNITVLHLQLAGV